MKTLALATIAFIGYYGIDADAQQIMSSPLVRCQIGQRVLSTTQKECEAIFGGAKILTGDSKDIFDCANYITKNSDTVPQRGYTQLCLSIDSDRKSGVMRR